MKGKKILLAKILHHSNLLQAVRLAVPGSKLIIFNYHRIRGGDKKIGTDFDDGVFGPTVDQFEHQVMWLKKNAVLLSENDLLSVFAKKKKLSNPSAMITFDDGYIDNYTLAYPILKKYNIPAIFFIPTQHIIERQLGWWDIIAYLVKKTKKKTIVIDDEQISLENRHEAIKIFLMKKTSEPIERTEHLLEKLSSVCEVSIPNKLAQSDELMAWEQIREVSRSGITIGSHTHSHNVLTTLSYAEQKKELSISKSILEQELGLGVNSISYPVGYYQHYSKDVQMQALECGYKLGFSFNTGVNDSRQINPFDVKRVESRGEIAMFAAMTLLPQIFT